jgi:hypothetical protein
MMTKNFLSQQDIFVKSAQWILKRAMPHILLGEALRKGHGFLTLPHGFTGCFLFARYAMMSMQRKILCCGIDFLSRTFTTGGNFHETTGKRRYGVRRPPQRLLAKTGQ